MAGSMTAKAHSKTTDCLGNLGAPARRALENAGITTVRLLSTCTEREILQLHGMGPSTIPKLKKALRDAGLTFKQR